MARLLELIRHVVGVTAPPARDVAVGGVTYDSRQVKPGDVFVAVPGLKADGHEFVADAVSRGAAAIIAERPVEAGEAAVALVENARRALAEVSAAFWGWPSRDLVMIGITGTNGKTTTSILVGRIAEAAGKRAAVLGTLGRLAGGQVIAGAHTTEEAPDLQAALAGLRDDGVEVVSMEVSSHGLAMSRTWQTYFDVGVLTNVTQDHLDFHATLAEYAAAKELLFTEYARLDDGYKAMRGAINLDDEWGRGIAAHAECEVVGFGVAAEGAAVRARDVKLGARETSMRLVTPVGEAELRTKLVGRFNVENALAAAAAAVGAGWALEAIVSGLEAADPAPGRMERVEAGQDFVVLVDYAHTPDAVAKVLAEARRLARRRLICVFGCGGDRDPSKRPKMGRAATEIADWTIITSDNPRSEDPADIIADMMVGAEEGKYEIVADRREAIGRAVGMAGEGDVVVIAGKGHEDYQILGERTIHFDDREEAAEAVRRRAEGKA
jgi:UDP-N-acetylmuramoyl-L-alanyl-D-glutamate--2,6-diaminopimelate ligase